MTNPKTSDSATRWFDRLCLLAVILSSALTMAPNMADADLWGHVQYGRDVITSGTLPTTATYTYTAEGYRWINHENLSEILMAAVDMTIGPLGLVWAKCLLGLIVIGLIIRSNLSDNVSWVTASLCGLLVAANLSYHWSIRPQLATMLLFAVLIGLLQFSFRGWRDRWHWTHPKNWNRKNWKPGDDQLDYNSKHLKALWLAIPLFVIWANSHGGFLAGLAIYLVYLSVRAFEAICQRGRSGWGLVRRMALMGFGATLACFINPYGPGLIRWLFYSVGNARPEISDWNNLPLFTIVGLKFWLFLIVTIVAAWISRRKLDLAHVIVLSLTVWQSIAHFRHVPFFAIAAGFWVAPHLQGAIDRFQISLGRNSASRGSWKLNAAVAFAILLIGSSLWGRLSELRVPQDKFPVAAIQYIHDQNIRGRMIVSFDWAQYALAALAADPAVPVDQRTRICFDGRFRTCYPQAIIDSFFDFTYGDTASMPRNRFGGKRELDPYWILEFNQPELVLIERQGERTSAHMGQVTDQWTLLYQDGISQLWGRKSVFDAPDQPKYIPPHLRLKSERRCVESVSWPALPEHQQTNHNHSLVLN